MNYDTKRFIDNNFSGQGLISQAEFLEKMGDVCEERKESFNYFLGNNTNPLPVRIICRAWDKAVCDFSLKLISERKPITI